MSAALPVGRPKSGLIGSGLIGLLAMGALAACSSVPDWANPVAWYDSVFSDDTASPSNPAPQSQSTAEGRQRLEEAQKTPAPKVGSVPERPRATPREERNAVASGLAADRDAARYTDEELRGRPASTSNLVAPAPPAGAPAPAAPAPAVAAAPAAPAAPPAAPQPAAPAVTTAPLTPPATTAPFAAAPLTTPPQPTPSTQTAAAPPPSTAIPIPVPTTTRPLATMPPPPAAGTVAPIRDTSILQSTYTAALAQSAATVTTAPANAAFATARPAPLARPATAVPPNVLQAYQETVPAAAYAAAPSIAPLTPLTPLAAPVAPLPATGLPGVNRAVPFDRAGSRLVGTVDFPAGGAGLDRRDREIISTALAEHNTRGGTIRVVGYAPGKAGSVGTFRLSQDRANAVANELVKEGANRQYVFVEARGLGAGGNANRVEVYLEN